MAAAGSDGRLVGVLASAGAALSPVAVVALAPPVALVSATAAASLEVTTPAGTLEAPPLSSFDEQLTARTRAPARAKRGAMRMRGSTLPTAGRPSGRGAARGVSNGGGRPTRPPRPGTPRGRTPRAHG